MHLHLMFFLKKSIINLFLVDTFKNLEQYQNLKN